MKARVVKCLSGACEVKVGNEQIICAIRGRLRSEKKSILVGDYVDINREAKVIEEIFERKNELLRPPIANIDQVIMVIAPKPKPDYFLVDQVMINAAQNKVKVILVINKQDLVTEVFMRECNEQYKGVVHKIIKTSFKEESGIEKLRKTLKNKFSVLVGQSGVGKSTILNKLCGTNQATGELSAKVERGVNTTRSSEVFKIKDGGEIVDTPGFSMLSLKKIAPNELASFYADINKYTKDCKYSTCNHIRKSAEECGVIDAITRGKLNPTRYARYVELYNMYTIEWNNRYK